MGFLEDKNCYDVIKMDLKMPIMNEFEATQKYNSNF